ncbi:MAG: hypothetical protein QG572_1262 [Pseudomonadota bacterium]|nr:hypothetical protein [Pseudomonadota bacterium]
MSKILTCLLVAIGLVAGGNEAAEQGDGKEKPAPRSRKAVAAGAEVIRSVAEVVAVDVATRAVTLKRDDGNTLTVVAGPNVKNFAQVKVGDFVIAEYGRALAISLKKGPGLRSMTESENGSVAKPGGKPAASGMRRMVIVADIIAIDDKKGFATVKGPKGNVVDVLVKDAKALAAVKIGDQVEMEYTEAVALSVKPAKSKR